MRPDRLETIPPELLERLQSYGLESAEDDTVSQEKKLRAQMQADALRPVDEYEDDEPSKEEKKEADKSVLVVSDELVEEAYAFLRLTVSGFHRSESLEP